MMLKNIIRSLAVCLFMLLCANAAQAQEMSSTNDKVDSSYVLQKGDRVDVKIYPEDEYLKGSEAVISDEGEITLPLLGRIHIEGKTVSQAVDHITDILARDYLNNPQVVIEVLEYQASTFVILGQVLKPGTYNFPAGARSITLLQALSLSGGFSDLANMRKIKIMRKSTGESINVNAELIISGNEPDVVLQPNDVVHVKESMF